MEQRPDGVDVPPGTSILVAEDHPATRRLLEKLLTKAGYKVITARNGQEALDRFKETFSPIVLIDWIMPEMDGLELCAALRSGSGQSYVYILFLTARDSKGDAVKAFQSGADDYVTKPFDREELLARIKTGVRVLALEKSLKEANDEIKMLSITDPLTGAYNRRYLSEHLPQELKRSLRYGRALQVIMCDIDHFKTVNDTYGHQAGDEILKAFAELVQRSIRQNVDWVARYGGEEFVLVLPETNASGAIVVAERLRQAVALKTYRVQGKRVRITVSWGISGIEANLFHKSLSSDALLNEADQCLLRAKEDGRNTVWASSIGKRGTTLRRKRSHG